MTLTPLLLVAAAGVLLFALPPRSEQSLKQDSDLIVVATVSQIQSSTTQTSADYSNINYRITLAVAAIEKGKAGKAIVATTYQPATRPSGWAGPQGQNTIPNTGDRVRAYLKKADGDTFALLEPNGLEIIQPATQPSSQPAK